MGKQNKNQPKLEVIALAGFVALVIILLCAAVFARQYTIIFSFLLAGTALLLAGNCWRLATGAAKEKKNQQDNELLSSFTTNQFVERCGDIVKQSDQNYAFLFFNLLDFDAYNEKHGYAAGDELLTDVCRVLKQMQKPDDRFARCFGVHFEGLFAYENESEIIDFLDQLQLKIEKLKFTTGICLITNLNDSLRLWEEKAQDALKASRADNKPYAFFREIGGGQLRSLILRDMQQGLADNEFVMYLQPRYDLNTNLICGAQALVRWVRTDGTIFYPQDMMGIFEESGFITKLDMSILKQACVKILKWIDNGYTPLPIAINISKLHILDAAFINGLSEMIQEYKIPTNLIEFDISQTSISVTMDKLLELNMQFDSSVPLIFMDDADENSAIKILESLPGDTVKLASDFFDLAAQNPKIYDAISKIIDMFSKRNVRVIAESIETEAQVALLKQLHCQVAQGFYFSRPVSPSQFDRIAFGAHAAKGQHSALRQ